MIQPRFLGLILSLCLAIPLVLSACTEPRQRLEWRAFSDAQKQEYIDAVLCLQASPAQTDLNGVVTRFDDLQATHILQTNTIHGVGQFLPWHRYMMWVYESKLIEECSYTGAQPYWNETMDVASGFLNSPLFDASDPLSFGGNGVSTNSNCVATGPFANYTLHLGPGQAVTNHCLTRNINSRNTGAAQSVIDTCLALDTFEDAWPCIENNGPHPAGHGGVSGEMVNVYSAPGDPVFYLHHAWVDKLWADWQALDKDVRITDIAGYTTKTPRGGSTDGLVPTTLEYVINMNDISPDVSVADLMDTEGDTLCYVYV